MSELALLGGEKSVQSDVGDMFKWPIVNKAMEDAVLDVLRNGTMSGMDISKQFEREFADWHGRQYGLAHNTGTASIQTGFYGLGVGCGDEIICPSITYWASCLPALSLGARVVFADIDPETLCIDPNDIEHRITERTKVIVVVHYAGMPADMDRIMEIADKHNVKVMEDVSHAHGGLYKGKMVGTFGDIACFSLMSGKSFAIGEAGIFITDDREIFERAIMFGHYARHSEIEDEELKQGIGLPWGGYKYRMHQMSSAVGLEQLKKYPEEIAEIDKAMNYFWDLLEDVPGIKAIRPAKDSGSTMGGWYCPHGLYNSEELGGLSIARFADAVREEGATCGLGCNRALHLHPVFIDLDIYGHGKPTQLAFQPEKTGINTPESLPISEGIQQRCFAIPWFKHYRKEIIEEHADAFRKVATNYEKLLSGDTEEQKNFDGQWGLTERKG